MNWDVWDQIESILLERGIRPILAVVPDNRDENLNICPPRKDFWNRIRQWQAQGWTIAMHGWQHEFVTRDSGMLRVNKYSEFAGLPAAEQERKLLCGRNIFIREGLDDSVFVAPAHSFDAVTVRLLRKLGFRYISDGFSLLPHIDNLGMLWIPQQLWAFRRRPFGVWTICFHINRWTSTDISRFRGDVFRYRDVISDFQIIVDQYGQRVNSVFDSAAARVYRCACCLKSAV